jgi:hypothetical protein
LQTPNFPPHSASQTAPSLLLLIEPSEPFLLLFFASFSLLELGFFVPLVGASGALAFSSSANLASICFSAAASASL